MKDSLYARIYTKQLSLLCIVRQPVTLSFFFLVNMKSLFIKFGWDLTYSLALQEGYSCIKI